MTVNINKVRADKWLWFARFFRTRSLSSKYSSENGIRINGIKTKKPSASLKPGDIITLNTGNTTKVVKILSCGVRRGSALDAELLYSLQYSSFLTENKNDSINLLKKALTKPRFDQEPIERVRDQVLSILKSNAKDPRKIASKVFFENVSHVHIQFFL